MNCPFKVQCLLLQIILWPTIGANRVKLETYSGDAEVATMIGATVSQLFKSLDSCHVILVSPSNDFLVLTPVAKNLNVMDIGITYIRATEALKFSQSQFTERFLDRTSKRSCQGLLLDLTLTGNVTVKDATDAFLNYSGVSSEPDVIVFAVGPLSTMEVFLKHQSLRNSIQVFYLALDDSIIRALLLGHRDELRDGGQVSVFSRCLYCDNGMTRTEVLREWQLHEGVPQNLKIRNEKISNYMGHQFRVVALPYFPYIDFVPETKANGAPLLMRNSLDQRIIDTFAQQLNFTYRVQEPADKKWGSLNDDGSWNGIVRSLEDEESDFSLGLTPTFERAQAIAFSRIYVGESMIIASTKPQPLPNYLSLIRPLSGMVWKTMAATVVVASLIMWLLHKIWAFSANDRGLSLTSAFLYNWGMMLEDPPNWTPSNSSSRIIVTTWLLYCLVMASAYRSSLVAHLTVQGKSAVINSFEDLLKNEGWSWGMSNASGAFQVFMNSSNDPVIKELAKEMKYRSVEENMLIVLEGNYGFITSKYLILGLIPTNYSDEFGYTKIYVSNTEYNPFFGVAWGFRKGIPIRKDMIKLSQKLMEAGLVDRWMKEVLSAPEDKKQTTLRKDDGPSALRVEHLLAAFILLSLGNVICLFTFLVEILARRCTRN